MYCPTNADSSPSPQDKTLIHNLYFGGQSCNSWAGEY